MVSGADNPPLPKDVLVKFYGLTKFLFLIEEPDDEQARMLSGDFSLGNIIIKMYRYIKPTNPTNIIIHKYVIVNIIGQSHTNRPSPINKIKINVNL